MNHLLLEAIPRLNKFRPYPLPMTGSPGVGFVVGGRGAYLEGWMGAVRRRVLGDGVAVDRNVQGSCVHLY